MRPSSTWRRSKILNITTGAIAKRMGVTQGALFRHFPSKDAILQAVMEWVSERLLARIDKATSAAVSPLDALEAAFIAHIEFISEHPGVPRMLFGELQRAEQTVAKRMAHTLIQRYGERLGRLVAEGKERGELAATLDDKAAVTLFIGTIQGLVMQSLIAGDVKRIRASAQERSRYIDALSRRRDDLSAFLGRHISASIPRSYVCG